MKILVVHRHQETVDLIRSVLSGCKAVVRQSVSGLDGLLTSRIEHFDLIICGTDLPVITGFELIRSIRTQSVNRSVPVLLIAEKLDNKTLHLGKALNVAGILRANELTQLLVNAVYASAKASKEKAPSELLIVEHLN